MIEKSGIGSDSSVSNKRLFCKSAGNFLFNRFPVSEIMSERHDFDFDGDSVPKAYDSILVPVLFEAWAEMLLQRLPPQPDWSILDLATGTGIVAQKLAEKLGRTCSIIGTDVALEMLATARLRCQNVSDIVSFIESPASPLEFADNSIDAIYCQQGFQFFPDKRSAAQEMYRVLRTGGKVAVSTWSPLEQCVFFGLIDKALRRCQLDEIAETLSIPFNLMPEDQLHGHFAAAGFHSITLEKCEKNLVFSRGVEQAYETVHATPLAPKLRALPEEKLSQFREVMLSEFATVTTNGVTNGKMTALVLTAEKVS
jgi:ubiquinone/menaquinone biosynthesis C-methylase UbiE